MIVAVCQTRKMSPVELNPPFMIISIVTTFVVVLTSLVLIFAKYCMKISWMWYICLTIVKCIGLFGMYVAVLSLFMVACVPQNLNWIGYMLVCLIFGYAFAYYFIWHLDNTVDYSKADYHKIVFLGLFHLPLSLMLVFFLPENLEWIVISILVVFSCLETATVILYSNKKGETNNV